MLFLVPTRVILHRAEPERPAQVDHFCARLHHARREIHRNVRRSREKHRCESLRFCGVEGARGAPGSGMSDGMDVRLGFPVFQQDRLDMRMMREDGDQLGSAVASKSDNSDGGF